MIRARDASVLVFQARTGRVANLTLHQAGDDGEWCGVDISHGRLHLDGCDISSEGRAGVVIRDGADPRLRHNKIHDCRRNGVYVSDSGLGTLEDNDITRNALSGVLITTGGDPILRRNLIDGNKSGTGVSDSGLGTLEDNDITGSALSGVLITTGASPTLRGNRINRNECYAVWIGKDGRGVIEDNDLTGNGQGGWSIAKDSKAHVIRARNKG